MPTPVIIKPKPKPIIIVDETDYESESVQEVIEAVNTAQEVSLEISTKEIVSVSKTESALATTYTLEVNTPEGVEMVTVNVDSETHDTHIIDYKPVMKPITVIEEEASHTEVAVDSKTGITIKKTTDKKLIQEDVYIQKVMEKEAMDVESIVSAVTRASESNVETIVSVKQDEKIKTVVSVVDVGSGSVTVIGEKETDLPEECNDNKLHGSRDKLEKCSQIIPTEEIFPTTVISSEIFKKVLSQNMKLQTVIQQLTTDHSQLVDAIPTQTVVEIIGTTTLFTFTFSQQRLVLQYSYDSVSTNIVSVYTTEIPEVIIPVVVETEVTETGSIIVTSNNLELIS